MLARPVRQTGTKPRRGVFAVLAAARATAQWVLAFGISFALTAGVLLLAHV